MSLLLQLLNGTWFREVYKGTEKQSRIAEMKQQDHVVNNIEFVRKDLIKLKGHHILVGRNSACDVILDNGAVSGKHCEIHKHVLGHWYVRDLRSTNGTHIQRGNSIVREETGEFKLEEGDILILGVPNDALQSVYLKVI